MIIWLALVVPIPAAAALYWKFHRKLTLWEVGLLVGVPIVLVAISKIVIETVQTSDTEFWGGYAERAEYYEDWNERVSCRHPKYRTETYTDSEGHTRTRRVSDGYEHLYDVDYHPEEWIIGHSLGGSVGIDKAFFERLAARFGNRMFVDLHRNYHTDDGDKYVSIWKGEPEKIEPVAFEHSYENRIQASTSVFNFKPVTPEDARFHGLHEYPRVNGHSQRVVLGNAGASTMEGERKLQYWNAVLGKPRQVRIFVLVFRGRSMQSAIEQQNHWKGGNKNEFVACVGIDQAAAVQWAYVFSWTEVDALKAEARDFLMGQKTLDLGAFADWIGPAVRERWIRKKFADFSYLTVEPPLWAVIVTFVVVLLSSGGIFTWALLNDVDPQGPDICDLAKPRLKRMTAWFENIKIRVRRIFA